MGEFDYYELRGVIVPGAIVVAGLAILYPDVKNIGSGTDFSLGELGVFIVLGYVAGHVVAAFGNFIEMLLWKARGGWPSEWIGKPKDRLLGPKQHERLIARMKTDMGIADIAQLDAKDWKGVNREMYARASKTDGATRLVDVFNSNYGLFRGVTTAFLMLAVTILIARGWAAWPWGVTALALAGVTAFRMDHFGQLYSKELVARYLATEAATGSENRRL